jgi:hypothetical protein
LVESTGGCEPDLRFSDGSHSVWYAAELIARDRVLTRPLADPAYFRRAFIESGRTGLAQRELSADGLHRRLAEA